MEHQYYNSYVFCLCVCLFVRLQPLQIKSAIAVESLKGYIYIEAFKQTHVKQVEQAVIQLKGSVEERRMYCTSLRLRCDFSSFSESADSFCVKKCPCVIPPPPPPPTSWETRRQTCSWNGPPNPTNPILLHLSEFLVAIHSAKVVWKCWLAVLQMWQAKLQYFSVTQIYKFDSWVKHWT